MIETIIIAVLSAALYAVLGYEKSVGEKIDLTKAGATMILGGIIGALMVASGIEVTQISVMGQVVMYAGTICVIENAIKAVFRRLKK